MTGKISQVEGRALFGLAPVDYDAVRPAYPDWVYDAISATGVLAPGARVLEIGPGTGQATRALRRYDPGMLMLVEPDARFAPQLNALMSDAPHLWELVHSSFESVVPARPFDLVVAATSFHWVDRATACQKLYALLRPGGVGALFWNVFQVPGKFDAFHEATMSLLAPLGSSPSGAPDSLPFALDEAARRADALAAGFSRVDFLKDTWTLHLDAADVGRLYGGYSNILRLPPGERQALLDALVTISREDFDSRVERNMTTSLFLLHR